MTRPLSRRGCAPAAAALVAALALVMPAAAIGGLYKCARDDGSVTYQEDPCPEGKELRDFERDPASVSVIPFRVAPGPDSRLVAPAPPAARSASERKPRKGGERPGNASERKFLVPGIGEGEVVARIGRPDMSTAGGRKIVRWTYLPAPDDPSTITTLTFELGRLVEVERKVIRTP
jgi:hypothetical protein